MRELTAALLLIAPLLVDPRLAAAQATGATQANPFDRQGAAPNPSATPSSPPPLAPRATHPRTGASTASGANQFPTENAARQACGTDTVVWVNTGGSRAWHVSGDRYYGLTKRGAYMCQQAAQQAGYHAAGSRAARAQRVGGQLR